MKPPIPLEPGRVVISKAGRDAGRPMIVLSLEGEQYALVADGRHRTVEKPKRKKNKHLAAKPACVHSIQVKLTNHVVLMNAELRAALEEAGYGRPNAPPEEGTTIGKE